MRIAALAALFMPALAVLSTACGMGSYADTPLNGGTGGIGGAGGTGGALSLGFETDAPLMLARRESRIVGVLVDPPGDHWVRFALLGDGEGTPGDASLDATDRRTDLTGRAEVTLTAPSVPATFLLRASVGTIAATLPVAVDASGLTSLTVVPLYSDQREIDEWVATVHANVTCGEVAGAPWMDGPYIGRAPFGEDPLVQDVPVGVSLAVTLRAGQFAGGCSNLPSAVEGEENRVVVTVINRPIQLASSSVDLVFAVDEPNAEARAMFDAVIQSAFATLFPPEATDVETLLDSMQATLQGSEHTAFRSARGAASWDSRVATALGERSGDFLREPLLRFLTLGLSSERDSLVEARLRAVEGEMERARVTLRRVANGTPEEAGFTTEFGATWQADAADNVLIGTSFAFSAPALLIALAEEPALAEVPDSTSVDGALAALSSCNDVASVLVEYGQADGVSYTGCDLDCTIALCEAGITALVDGFAGLDPEMTSSIDIAATGRATVGEEAELAGLDGSWVGNIDVDGAAAQLSGSLSTAE